MTPERRERKRARDRERGRAKRALGTPQARVLRADRAELRAIFCEIYLVGMTVEDVAEKLGITPKMAIMLYRETQIARVEIPADEVREARREAMRAKLAARREAEWAARLERVRQKFGCPAMTGRDG